MSVKSNRDPASDELLALLLEMLLPDLPRKQGEPDLEYIHRIGTIYNVYKVKK